MNYNQRGFLTPRSTPKAVRKPVMVRELPAEERPVNRLHQYGASSLSTAEIIAGVLQTPDALHQANTMLAKFDGLIGLARAPLTELQELPGIGPAQAARLKAALELGRRVLLAYPSERAQIKSPDVAANMLMMEMMHLEQEHLVVLLLNTRNRLIKTVTVYVGSLNTNMVRVGEVFKEAIRHNAAAIIVAHNHPSGEPSPSPEDVHLTQLLVEAGTLLNIDVLDRAP